MHLWLATNVSMATFAKFPEANRSSSPSAINSFDAISGSYQLWPQPWISTIISRSSDLSCKKYVRLSTLQRSSESSPHGSPVLFRYLTNSPTANSSTITFSSWPMKTFRYFIVCPYYSYFLSSLSFFLNCLSQFLASKCIWTTFLVWSSILRFVFAIIEMASGKYFLTTNVFSVKPFVLLTALKTSQKPPLPNAFSSTTNYTVVGLVDHVMVSTVNCSRCTYEKI